MKCFELNSNYFEAWVGAKGNEATRFLTSLDSSTLAEFVPNVPIVLDWKKGEAQEQKWLDMHTYSPVFCVFSDRAKNCLMEFLKPNGYFIETQGLSDKYFIYNVTTVLSGSFHWEKSEIKGSPDHLSEIKKAAFLKDKVKGFDVFKIDESRVDIFVSEAFKRRVEDCGLSGFLLDEVTLV